MQAEADIAAREKSAEQLQDDLAAQDESIAKLSKDKKSLEAAKQVRYLTIIPRARVGYEMLDSQQGAKRRVGHDHLIDLADFALHEQPEENLMVSISQAWYNDSYTMAAKPMKFLELHRTMVQFLMKDVYFLIQEHGI